MRRCYHCRVQHIIPLAGFTGASQFLRTYAGDFTRVAPWFHYNPHDRASFAQRLTELDARPQIDRSRYAQAVVEMLRGWGAGATALAAAAALGEPGTYSVVTGQQVGLFGGPLYTQLKAVATILMARRLGEMFPGRRFVPTFWMGTSDSDFDEVRHAHFINREGTAQTIALAPGAPEDEGQVVSARLVQPELLRALAELEAALPGGLHRDATLAALRAAYAPEPQAAPSDTGLGGGFARFMAHLFHDTELVLIDPQQPVLMQAAIPLIERELQAAAEIEAALIERNATISAAGFTLQVEQLSGDTSLFLLDEHQRRRKLSREGDGFVLRQTGEAFTKAQLLSIAHDAPQRFVAGVMLRPIYQNTLFPPAAFIGGGAELAYRAQVTAAFDCHGQRMAPAFFRASATLMPAKSAAALDELGLELADCYCVPQELADRAVAHTRPGDIDAALARYREVLNTADRDVEAHALKLDPALGETFATLRGNLERHVEKLEKKINSALKQRHETLVRRIAAVQTLVYPQLALQERVLGLASFLPRYGPDMLSYLQAQLEPGAWDHRILILD
jgi:bacillithiol synthase